MILNTVVSTVLALSLTAYSVFRGDKDDTYSKITDFEPHIFKYSEGLTASQRFVFAG